MRRLALDTTARRARETERERERERQRQAWLFEASAAVAHAPRCMRAMSEREHGLSVAFQIKCSGFRICWVPKGQLVEL